MNIHTAADFDKAIENGPYAWPGGYPCFFITTDGAALSFDAANENADLIRQAIADGDTRCGWHVCGFDVNWEDADLYCDHTSQRIPSAYADAD